MRRVKAEMIIGKLLVIKKLMPKKLFFNSSWEYTMNKMLQ